MAKLSSTSVYGNLYVDGEIVNSALDAELGQSIKSLSVNGKTITYTKNDGTTGTIETQDTNTTYGNATTSTSGLMSSADKTKLDGIAANANNYSHPTTSGNKHIPAGGSSGQILRWASDGTATWGNDNNTTYSTGTASTSGLTKLYTGTGTATDGTMTQSAINSALSGKVNKTGDTMTGSLKNSLHTGTWLEGNQGIALLSSTNTAGYFTTLVKSNSANGYFALSNFQDSLYLTYTAKATVDAGTNSTTKSAVLLNESGNSTFPGNVKASSFSGSLSGNASTATKLQTARTINGTSFDGSANITTANWGTARNLQIGNSSKSVNGSANVSWSLGEIGAVPVSTGSAVTIHADSDSSSTSEYLLLKAGHNELKITSSAGGSTVTKSNTNLTYNGNQVYHAGNPQTTISGNAGTATKLQTARSINGTSFDGSGNITTANWGTARNLNGVSVNGSTNYTIPVENYYCSIGDNNTNLYHRILTTDIATTNYTDKSLIIVMHSGYNGGGFGIAKITFRTSDISSAANSQGEIKWLVRSGFAANALVFNLVNQAKNACMDVFYKSPGTYAGMTWYVLSEGGRSENHSKQWVKYNTNASGTNAYTEENMKTLRTYTTTLVSATDAGHVSTANSASTLTTARTINGTSFNGTGNITTANWGAARNIQIGNTAKSVNGSANVSWSLSEIGAAASNHTHSNYASTSHTHSSLTGTAGSTTAPSTGTGVMRYDYNVSSENAGTLPNNNNANGILTLNTHSGNYYNQLGFSSNGNLYYRAFNGKALDTTTAWKQIAFTDSNITGNAATATKLQTIRTINGTNFDGTSNITTANWGTARTITIGSTGKSVNGSGNVSWSLSEIGAAAASHTHNYAGSSSAGGNANAAVKLATARTINGTNFDGTGNITTANWGTARNIQIGNAVKSVNGSGNVSWNWSEMQVPRAYSSSYNFGGNQNAITTEQFITMLTNLGAFSQVYWVSRGSWSYASNQYINDTGCGNIHLAGCVVEVIGTTSAYTIRVTTPTTTANGTVNAEFIYVNNGKDYSPGWRRQYNTKNKPTASEIGAAAASHTHSYLPLTGGTLSGNVVLNNNIAIGGKDTSETTKWVAWVDKANNAQFGDVSIKSVINSNANPEVNICGKGICTLYHTGNKPTAAEIGAAPALALANSYYGMVTNDGNSSNWIRTTQNGIIPYQSGGSSSLGTSSWPFNAVYATNFYGTLNGNATHWGGRQVWWGAAGSRPGNGYIQFVW